MYGLEHYRREAALAKQEQMTAIRARVDAELRKLLQTGGSRREMTDAIMNLIEELL